MGGNAWHWSVIGYCILCSARPGTSLQQQEVRLKAIIFETRKVTDKDVIGRYGYNVSPIGCNANLSRVGFKFGLHELLYHPHDSILVNNGMMADLVEALL